MGRSKHGEDATERIRFWVVTIPILALAAVLLAHLASVARTLGARPEEVVVEPEHGHLVWSRMGYLILEGDDLASLLGSVVAIGLGPAH